VSATKISNENCAEESVPLCPAGQSLARRRAGATSTLQTLASWTRNRIIITLSRNVIPGFDCDICNSQRKIRQATTLQYIQSLVKIAQTRLVVRRFWTLRK
jgi:hypothetical protein